MVSGAKSGANFSFNAYCNLVKRVEVVILLLQSINEVIFHLENLDKAQTISNYLYLYQIRAYIFNLINEKDLACDDLNKVNKTNPNYSYDLENWIKSEEFKIICD